MQTLAQRFGARRADLEIQVRDRETTEALRRLDKALEELQREALDDLVEAQVRVAIPLLHLLRHGLGSVRALRVVSPDQTVHQGVVSEAPAILRGVGRLLSSGALAVCVVALLLEIQGFLGYVAMVTFALYVALEIWAAVDRSRRQGMKEAAARALQAERGPGHGALDVDLLFQHIERSLQLIDEAIPDAEELRKKRSLADGEGPEIPRALLSFLQDLLEDRHYEDAKVALERVRGLPALLRRLDIEMVEHPPPPELPHEAESLFEFEPDLSGEARENLTLAPALVRGERILLRGRVRSAAADEGQP